MLHKLPCLIYLHFSNLTWETKRSPQLYLAVLRDVTNNKCSVLRRQRNTNWNIKRLVHYEYGKWSLTFERRASSESVGPSLAFTIHIGSTPTFSYFDLYHIKVRLHTAINRADFVSWCMLYIHEGKKMHSWENDDVLSWVDH